MFRKRKRTVEEKIALFEAQEQQRTKDPHQLVFTTPLKTLGEYGEVHGEVSSEGKYKKKENKDKNFVIIPKLDRQP